MLISSVVIVKSSVVPVVKFRVLYFFVTNIELYSFNDVILWHFVHERARSVNDKTTVINIIKLNDRFYFLFS